MLKRPSESVTVAWLRCPSMAILAPVTGRPVWLSRTKPLAEPVVACASTRRGNRKTAANSSRLLNKDRYLVGIHVVHQHPHRYRAGDEGEVRNGDVDLPEAGRVGI